MKRDRVASSILLAAMALAVASAGSWAGSTSLEQDSQNAAAPFDNVTPVGGVTPGGAPAAAPGSDGSLSVQAMLGQNMKDMKAALKKQRKAAKYEKAALNSDKKAMKDAMTANGQLIAAKKAQMKMLKKQMAAVGQVSKAQQMQAKAKQQRDNAQKALDGQPTTRFEMFEAKLGALKAKIANFFHRGSPKAPAAQPAA